MQACWQVSGNNYFPDEKSSQMDLLPPGVYNIKHHPIKGLFLAQTDDCFEFNHKIYGVEEKFVNRVITSYNSVTDNLGVLLNGIKGSGKSVTSKLICNRLKDSLPIIIVDAQYDGLPQFIAEIQQEIIVFIDEYEKIYENYSSDVLTIMDGVFKTAHKRLFLLTTNNLYINQNMLQRPGRIRYLKTFGDLELSVVNEIIDDMLIYPVFKDDCIEAISTLEIITIDLVKAIINEVNIHNESPKEFMDVFNVKNKSGDDDKTEIVITNLENPDEPIKITNPHVYGSVDRLEQGYHISVPDYKTFVKIIEKYDKNTFKIRCSYRVDTAAEYTSSGKYTNPHPDTIKLENGDFLTPIYPNDVQENCVTVDYVVMITEKPTKHYFFNKMAF